MTTEQAKTIWFKGEEYKVVRVFEKFGAEWVEAVREGKTIAQPSDRQKAINAASRQAEFAIQQGQFRKLRKGN